MPGQPEPGSNVVFVIDATGIRVTDNDGIPSQLVLDTDKQIRMNLVFEIDGLVIPLLDGQKYKVTYAFAPLSNTPAFTTAREGSLKTSLPSPTKVYKDADTEVKIPAGTIKPGLYQLSAFVQFPKNPGIAAFTTLPVIEVIKEQP
ncbi:hypothetical protein ABT404_44620 [Streptomyces hyaluromycini]|uniref:Uncharacterized protein n=1 Tax=Streptomyces hyaluromycini TaxID=1377993 RepID=A0ABV1XBR4_9ACTN